MKDLTALLRNLDEIKMAVEENGRLSDHIRELQSTIQNINYNSDALRDEIQELKAEVEKLRPLVQVVEQKDEQLAKLKESNEGWKGKTLQLEQEVKLQKEQRRCPFCFGGIKKTPTHGRFECTDCGASFLAPVGQTLVL